MCLKEEPIFIQAQMHIFTRPCKWAWKNEDSSFYLQVGLGPFMWQQLPCLLHLVLQGIYRKKISTFWKIFAKNNNQKIKFPSILTPSLNPRKEVGLKGPQLWHISQQILTKSWSPGFNSYFWRLFTRNIFLPLLPTYLQQQYSIPLENFGSPGSIGTSRGLSSIDTTNIPHSPPVTHERQKRHPSSPHPRHY